MPIRIMKARSQYLQCSPQGEAESTDEEDGSEGKVVMERFVDPSEINARVRAKVAAKRLNTLKHILSNSGLLPKRSMSPAIIDPPRQYGIVTHYLLDDKEPRLFSDGTNEFEVWKGKGNGDSRLTNTLDYEDMAEGVGAWEKMMGDRRFYDWDGLMRATGSNPEKLLARLEENIPKSGLVVINLAKTLGIEVPRKHAYAFYVVPKDANPKDIEALARTYNVKPKRKN